MDDRPALVAGRTIKEPFARDTHSVDDSHKAGARLARASVSGRRGSSEPAGYVRPNNRNTCVLATARGISYLRDVMSESGRHPGRGERRFSPTMVRGGAIAAAALLIVGCSSPSQEAAEAEQGTTEQNEDVLAALEGVWACEVFSAGNPVDAAPIVFDFDGESVTIAYPEKLGGYTLDFDVRLAGTTLYGETSENPSDASPGQTWNISAFPLRVPADGDVIPLTFASTSGEPVSLTAYREGEAISVEVKSTASDNLLYACAMS